MTRSLREHLVELHQSRAVLRQLVRQQLVLRYRRTAIGYLWTLVNPLLMMTVTAVVFASLFHVDVKAYAIFLFAGMIPWNCFQSIVTQSAVAFIQNESLIKKIYLPKLILPLSVSLAVFVDSVLSFGAFYAIILLLGGQPSFMLLFIPIAFILLFFFAFGFALAASVATVFFRDLQYIIGIAMQAWFFLTPVMYRNEALAGKIASLVGLNPLVPFIRFFRASMNTGDQPSGGTALVTVALALGSVLLGLFIFLRQERKIVFRL